ncbi:hypothetical protein HBI56_072620 [Parastagonospora nodorum]|nr:hypothetical protein HBH50_237030 [Parastagonospora nodorum]KAH4092535.1 hypothetical protein HBH48_087670 [Parastagonospora nodorum]KAH5058454.1 hypothetical protein HBI73_210810 [Parastagonospora nodorum]KAH5175330.1 hypothetical protein HBH76_223180 [Parastagonospora nodorum]KAH5224144.1 hypothetical protein HBI62_115840 [Parastagonospora nodorum]
MRSGLHSNVLSSAQRFLPDHMMLRTLYSSYWPVSLFLLPHVSASPLSSRSPALCPTFQIASLLILGRKRQSLALSECVLHLPALSLDLLGSLRGYMSEARYNGTDTQWRRNQEETRQHLQDQYNSLLEMRRGGF